jgi:hypothetical protein
MWVGECGGCASLACGIDGAYRCALSGAIGLGLGVGSGFGAGGGGGGLPVVRGG